MLSENQKILKLLEKALADLDEMLKKHGLSEAEILPIYVAVLKENGIAARLLGNLTAKVLPLSAGVDVKPDRAVEELRRLRSGEFAKDFLAQSEPTPKESKKIQHEIRSALANLGQHFTNAGKTAPRHRRGGRREAVNPALYEQIRKEIKLRRDPETTLQTIYEQLGRKYGVSPRTIKRIREEKPVDKYSDTPQEES